MDFFTRYSPPPDFGVDFPDKSMTHQEFASECDINTIISRAAINPIPPPPDGGYFDADLLPSSFEEAQSIVINARNQFASLPSRIRDRFANDPTRLLSFLADSSNLDEAISLGLVTRPSQPVVEQVPNSIPN